MVAALSFTAKKIAYRQSDKGIVISFLIHHAELPNKLAVADLGTSYMVALVEIDDNDQPAAAQERNRPEAEPLPGGAAAVQTAGALCKDKRFQTFLQEEFAGGWRLFNGEADDYERAVEFVRWKCGVRSRAEIKTNEEALFRWRELHGLYSAWATL